MLGETFELVTPAYEFISEQVSHHPPISAFITKGRSGYIHYSNNFVKVSFNGKNIVINNVCRSYIELPMHNEKFEIIPQTMSFHNYIVGKPYMDCSGIMKVKEISNPQNDIYTEVKFFQRGYFY